MDVCGYSTNKQTVPQVVPLVLTYVCSNSICIITFSRTKSAMKLVFLPERNIFKLFHQSELLPKWDVFALSSADSYSLLFHRQQSAINACPPHCIMMDPADNVSLRLITIACLLTPYSDATLWSLYFLQILHLVRPHNYPVILLKNTVCP